MVSTGRPWSSPLHLEPPQEELLTENKRRLKLNKTQRSRKSCSRLLSRKNLMYPFHSRDLKTPEDKN